jgi:polysaccharide biosynthesis transport protein
LFGGVAIVVMRERNDRSIRAPGGTRTLLNIPELGAIPTEGPGLRKRWGEILSCPDSSSSTTSEAYRVVLASILLSGDGEAGPQLLVVTSSSPAEGKTTIATNLAFRLSSIGKKVLLVDADLSRPRLHEIFEVGNATGLTTVLESGSTDYETIKPSIHQITPNLAVLPAGPQTSDSADLLFLGHVSEVLATLRNEYEMLVIDTPSAPQSSQARVLGRLADGVVVVIRAGQTTREAAAALVQRLDDDRCNVLGTVLNDWNPKLAPSDSYGRMDQPSAVGRSAE